MLASLRTPPTRSTRIILTFVIVCGALGRAVRGEVLHGPSPATHALAALYLGLAVVALRLVWSTSIRRGMAGVVACELAAVAFGALDMQLLIGSRGAVNGMFAQFYAGHPALAASIVHAGLAPAQVIALAQHLSH